jgi:hypothetical protein
MTIGSGLIFPMVRMMMNSMGYPFIHASSVAKRGAVLFAARHAGGKTTKAMEYIHRGYQLMSDDFSIIHGGKTFCFPTPLNIFYYNKSVLPREIREVYRKDLLLKRILYHLTLKNVRLFTTVPPYMVSSIRKTSKIKEVHMLDSIDVSNPSLQLMFNNKLDMFPFIDYMNEYSFFYPNSMFGKHWDSLKNNIKKSLRGVKVVYDKKL